MKIECNKDQIAIMLAREIDDAGSSIPKYMQVREFVQNSVEAVMRKLKKEGEKSKIPKNCIEIKPIKLDDYEKSEKITIINFGEDLTREVIQNHLLNYRNSGNTLIIADENKGIGWKIVSLSKNAEGVRYYFWDNDECL